MGVRDQPDLLVRDRLEQRQVQVSAAGGGGAGQRAAAAGPEKGGQDVAVRVDLGLPLLLEVEIGDDAAGLACGGVQAHHGGQVWQRRRPPSHDTRTRPCAGPPPATSGTRGAQGSLASWSSRLSGVRR